MTTLLGELPHLSAPVCGVFASTAHQASAQGGNDVGLKGEGWLNSKLLEHSINFFDIR